MKVKSISIKKFNQFKDLFIDLTYPKGHKKEGEPLDKICIIGQSGTGKTTLLNLIDGFTYRLEKLEKYTKLIENVEFIIKLKDLELKEVLKIYSGSHGGASIGYFRQYFINGEDVERYKASMAEKDYLKEIDTHLIYYPVNLDYDIPEIISEEPHLNEDLNIFDFSMEKAANVWNLILSEIKKYREEEFKRQRDISRIAERSKTAKDSNWVKEIEQAVENLRTWKEEFKSPLEALAENCLNPILERFSLKVKTEFEKLEDIGFIKIVDFNGSEVPHAFWSTGTKQVILSALPLYLLKPEKTIILYDEPERSLYPDLQHEIIEYYLRFMKDCQFIVATHSPLIAASFEPWEIVELKFKKEGYVYRELYYKGENHVDNYFVDPRYLTYELILKKIFDLKQTGSREREKLLMEFIEIKSELDSLKENGKLDTKKAKDLYQKYESFAKTLGWDITSDL